MSRSWPKAERVLRGTLVDFTDDPPSIRRRGRVSLPAPWRRCNNFLGPYCLDWQRIPPTG